MPVQQFRLPDVGEGLTEAEVVTWRVARGDTVAVNDVVVEIETAKSLVELPSPFAGVVRDLLVEPGVTVEVGTPIIAVDVEGAVGAPEDGDGADGGGDEDPGGNLVGYGPTRRASRRRARTSGPSAPPRAAEPAPAPEPEPAPEPTPEPTPASAPAARPLAAPPVRLLARDRGVDLAAVTPTGGRGEVTRADVLAHASAPARTTPTAPTAAAGETRVPVRGVRRAMADAMVRSVAQAPQATLFHTLDVTRTVKLVAAMKADERFADVRVSPLVVAVRAVVLALARTPEMGARWDEAAGEVVVPAGAHVGVAAATPRGLVVPVLRDAHTLDLHGLAAGLTALTTTAREGRTPPAAMTGGTFTVTNIGALGIESGAPILNPGETGILATGAFARRPWVHRGKVRPRWTATLALTVDHRVVDGAQAGRFLADVAAVLEEPAQALV